MIPQPQTMALRMKISHAPNPIRRVPEASNKNFSDRQRRLRILEMEAAGFRSTLQTAPSGRIYFLSQSMSPKANYASARSWKLRHH